MAKKPDKTFFVVLTISEVVKGQRQYPITREMYAVERAAGDAYVSALVEARKYWELKHKPRKLDEYVVDCCSISEVG